jgi:hypothetical protein
LLWGKSALQKLRNEKWIKIELHKIKHNWNFEKTIFLKHHFEVFFENVIHLGKVWDKSKITWHGSWMVPISYIYAIPHVCIIRKALKYHFHVLSFPVFCGNLLFLFSNIMFDILCVLLRINWPFIWYQHFLEYEWKIKWNFISKHNYSWFSIWSILSFIAGFSFIWRDKVLSRVSFPKKTNDRIFVGIRNGLLEKYFVEHFLNMFLWSLYNTFKFKISRRHSIIISDFN